MQQQNAVVIVQDYTLIVLQEDVLQTAQDHKDYMLILQQIHVFLYAQ